MKLKRLLLHLGASILGIASVVVAFLPMFAMHVVSGDGSNDAYSSTKFGIFGEIDDLNRALFDNLNGGYKPFGKTLAVLAAIVMIIAVIGIIAAFVMDLMKMKKNVALVGKLSSLVMIGASVLFIVATLIYTASNSINKFGVITEIAVESFIMAILPLLLGVGSGVCGLLNKKK